MKLFAFSIHSAAIVAESIAAVTRSALVLGYVAAWWARTIIVVNTICGWFRNFIDGIKLSYCRHGLPPLASILAHKGLFCHT
jgi:hypothetical protein